MRDALRDFGVRPGGANGGPGAAGAASSAATPQGAAGQAGGAGAAQPQSAQPQASPPAKTVAQVLGEIVWLMTQSPRHKSIPLGDLEWLAMPAILLKQFRMFYAGERPVGVALWALADDAVAKRIDAGDKRLAPRLWRAAMRLCGLTARHDRADRATVLPMHTYDACQHRRYVLVGQCLIGSSAGFSHITRKLLGCCYGTS